MNKQDLVSKIIYAINKTFNEKQMNKSIITISDCYHRSNYDIKKIGEEVIESLMMDNNNSNELDKMISNYYYIFKYYNYYIIINYICDSYNTYDVINYHIKFVNTRREALINRYGD